jgi:hypothetical protein
MNDPVYQTTELTRQQTQAIADYLMLQYGTMLFMRLAFLTVVLALISVIFGKNRLAMFFFFVVGVFSFLVPSPITLLVSPIIMLLSVGGGLWFTIKRRRERRRAIEAHPVGAAPPAS